MKCTAVSCIEGKLSQKSIDISGLTIEEAVQKQIFWLDIQSDSREKVAEMLYAFGIPHDYTAYIKRPGDSIRLRVLQTNKGIVDLLVSRSAYVTLIYQKEITIIISPESFSYLEPVMLEWNAQVESKRLDAIEMTFGLFNHLLDINSDLAFRLNQKINDHSKKIIGKPFVGEISDIELLKQDVLTLLEVFESQYTSFGLLPLHFTGQKERMEMLQKIVLGIEHQQRVMERADDKLDIIYHKYLYDLQDQTNRKIKTLTILQSIFVPITFIAGLYGMNFANMPELSWQTGYLYALGLMGFIVALELIIFYKNGWFK
jgi:magnesium transporter